MKILLQNCVWCSITKGSWPRLNVIPEIVLLYWRKYDVYTCHYLQLHMLFMQTKPLTHESARLQLAMRHTEHSRHYCLIANTFTTRANVISWYSTGWSGKCVCDETVIPTMLRRIYCIYSIYRWPQRLKLIMNIPPHVTFQEYCQVAPVETKAAWNHEFMTQWAPLKSSDDKFQYNANSPWSPFISTTQTKMDCVVAIIVDICSTRLSACIKGIAWVMHWHYGTHKTQKRLMGHKDYFPKTTNWPDRNFGRVSRANWRRRPKYDVWF